jgi:hypothetical protein
MTTDTRATTEENRSEEDTRLIPAALQKFLKAGGRKKKKKKTNKQTKAGLLGIQESTKRNAEVFSYYQLCPSPRTPNLCGFLKSRTGGTLHT